MCGAAVDILYKNVTWRIGKLAGWQNDRNSSNDTIFTIENWRGSHRKPGGMSIGGVV